jgi:hypothetical protein
MIGQGAGTMYNYLPLDAFVERTTAPKENGLHAITLTMIFLI